MVGVPYAARALVGTLPALAMVEPVTMEALLADLGSQIDDLHVQVENIMQTGRNTFLLHCFDRAKAQDLSVSGVTFRGHLISFKPAANTQWVKLTRVVYGTSENAIKSRMAEYGTVLKIRHE